MNQILNTKKAAMQSVVANVTILGGFFIILIGIILNYMSVKPVVSETVLIAVVTLVSNTSGIFLGMSVNKKQKENT